MKKYLLLVTLLSLLVGCGPKNFNYGTSPLSFPQLTVQAEGEVQANPDQLQLRLGVVTEAKDAGQALEQNNQKMAMVMQQVAKIGIVEAEMATGQFHVRPEWSRPPRPTPANWQREIIGYQVNNELLIKTTQVELAGKLLGLAQRAGANQIGGLQFSLADATAYKQQAIEIATDKAIRKATTMAAAAGVTLGDVQSLSLGGSEPGSRPMFMAAEAKLAAAESVPVAAGKVTVAATVEIVYQLVNQAGK